MRLYLTVWDDGQNPKSYEWTGTQADQKAVVKRETAEGNEIVRNEAIEVPDDKAGRLNFYNTFRLRPDLD